MQAGERLPLAERQQRVGDAAQRAQHVPGQRLQLSEVLLLRRGRRRRRRGGDDGRRRLSWPDRCPACTDKHGETFVKQVHFRAPLHLQGQERASHLAWQVWRTGGSAAASWAAAAPACPPPRCGPAAVRPCLTGSPARPEPRPLLHQARRRQVTARPLPLPALRCLTRRRRRCLARPPGRRAAGRRGRPVAATRASPRRGGAAAPPPGACGLRARAGTSPRTPARHAHSDAHPTLLGDPL